MAFPFLAIVDCLVSRIRPSRRIGQGKGYNYQPEQNRNTACLLNDYCHLFRIDALQRKRSLRAMKPVIVPITRKHITGFRKCLDAVARERRYLVWLEARPLPAIRKFVLEGLRKDNPQLVALQDDRVVGWCDIWRPELPVYNHVGVLGMGVLKEFRGRGLGWRLIEATLKCARDVGIERVELTVYASNKRAIRLYESVGFVHEGVKRKGRKLDGKYEDVLMMAKLFKVKNRPA
jgi:RimJ/RimL family protein N-acetyltransferase